MMLIEVPPKFIDLLLRVVQRREPMHVQAFFAESAVEGFNGGIVRRLAALERLRLQVLRLTPRRSA
jgi:hypothetical protein